MRGQVHLRSPLSHTRLELVRAYANERAGSLMNATTKPRSRLSHTRLELVLAPPNRIRSVILVWRALRCGHCFRFVTVREAQLKKISALFCLSLHLNRCVADAVLCSISAALSGPAFAPPQSWGGAQAHSAESAAGNRAQRDAWLRHAHAAWVF